MTRYLTATLALLALAPTAALAGPRVQEPRLHPNAVAPEPSYVKRVEPAIVALRVQADREAPSSARLGHQRFASGVIFDARGYVVTVSYALLDAVAIEARTRGGRSVPARLTGLDLETGLGIVQLLGEGPWSAAALGPSADAAPGMRTATIGVDEDNDLVHVSGSLQAVRRFSGFWEYMLDRALLVAPSSPSWGGSAVVNDAGQVIGIASLRLGEPPHVNLAIPLDTFVRVKEELIASGRVLSRRPRPWLGLYTSVVGGAVVVEGFAPVGPAAGAGFRRGDRILSVNDLPVVNQEEFYEALWRHRAGDVIRVAVQRAEAVHVIAVRSIDRYRLLRSPAR